MLLWIRLKARPITTIILLMTLSSCSAIGGITAGVVTSAVASNPIVGMATATITNAAIDSGIKYIMRQFSLEEQQKIADTIGKTAVGEQTSWAVKNQIPYANNSGHVIVINVSQNALTTCKEALFSILSKKNEQPIEQWYTINVCQNGQNWQWAQAEPATSRWGSLQ